MANLQLLCVDCHVKKSSIEQKLVNKTRWTGRDTAGFQRLTHFEKDELILTLKNKIDSLQLPPNTQSNPKDIYIL